MQNHRHIWNLVLPHRRLLAGLLVGSILLALMEGVGLGLVLVLLGAGGSVAGTVARFPLLNELLRHVHGLPIDSRIRLAVLTLLTTTLVRSALQYGNHLLTLRLRRAVETPIQQQVFRRFHELPLSEIQSQRQGRLLLLLGTYPRKIGEIVLRLARTLANTLVLVTYIGLALFVSWPLTLLSVALLTAVALGLRPMIGRRLRRASHRNRELMQESVSTAQEHLAAVKLIRLFGREAWSQTNYEHQLEAYHEHEFVAEKLSGLTRPIFTVLNVIVVGAVLLAATAFLHGSSQVVLAHLALFLIIAFRLTGPVGEIAEMQSQVIEIGPIIEAVFGFLQTSPGTADVAGGTRQIGCLSDGIVLENVTFRYAPEEAPVLRGLSLQIGRGKTTAIVGASGAGKSTLAALVSRLYDPAEGGIRVDGIDLRELDPVGWRRKIAVVSQDVFVFHASVWENLRFARPEATDEQIYQACRLARAHEFVMALPQGYDTVLQERGLRLSGGQRQRIALARALLVDAELLILDEATSEIDGTTERAIHDALAEHTVGRTVLIIAHRLSTIQNADRIYVLRHGRVAEEGRHAELLAAGGLYARMVAAQDHDVATEKI